MKINNCLNSKLTDYGNKNFPVHQHNKSLVLPQVQNSMKKLIENSYSFSDKSLNFKVDNNRKNILEDLSSLFERYDSGKNLARSEKRLRKIDQNVENLVFYEKFYKDFKVI